MYGFRKISVNGWDQVLGCKGGYIWGIQRIRILGLKVVVVVVCDTSLVTLYASPRNLGSLSCTYCLILDITNAPLIYFSVPCLSSLSPG